MPNKFKYASNCAAQRQRLIEALKEKGAAGITTIQAREELDIMAPAPRVYELRHEFGFNIQLIYTKGTNAQGHSHTCARYVLLPGRWKGSTAA